MKRVPLEISSLTDEEIQLDQLRKSVRPMATGVHQDFGFHDPPEVAEKRLSFGICWHSVALTGSPAREGADSEMVMA